MRPLGPFLFVLTLSFPASCLAQQWELGGSAGYGLARNLTVSNAAGSATTGFKGGAALGAVAGQSLYNYLGGEFRYVYRFGDLKLSAGGTEVIFSGLSHAVHYDLLVFARRRNAPVRPFIALGGGVKIYQGTGKEAAYQPLNTFAILTKTREVEGLGTVGGGIQVKIAPHVFLRTEFRDYITPVPKQVIAPVRGAKLSGVVHDFVPLVGIRFGIQ